MQRQFIFLIAGIVYTSDSLAQKLDTLIFTDKKIIATVTEVAPEFVAYRLPGKDVLYKEDRIHLIRICYADGKVEISPLINKEPNASPDDWQKVVIASSPAEIYGLYKIGEVVVPGTTSLSDRSKAWLKMQAAMIGGNVVYVDATNRFASTGYVSTPLYSGGKASSYYSHPYTRIYSQTYASVYASKLPDTIAFRKLALQQPTLSLMGNIKQKRWKKIKVAPVAFPSYTRITKYYKEDNSLFVYITGYGSTKFRVSYFDKNKIILSQRNVWNGRYEGLLFLINHQPSLAENEK